MFHCDPAMGLSGREVPNVDFSKSSRGIIELGGMPALSSNTKGNQWGVQPRNIEVTFSLELLDDLYSNGSITSADHASILAHIFNGVIENTHYVIVPPGSSQLQHADAKVCALLASNAPMISHMDDKLYIPPGDISNAYWAMGLYTDQTNYQFNSGLRYTTTLEDPGGLPGRMIDPSALHPTTIGGLGVTEWQVTKYPDFVSWKLAVVDCDLTTPAPPVYPTITLAWDDTGWHFPANQVGYQPGSKVTGGTSVRTIYGALMQVSEPTSTYAMLHTGSMTNDPASNSPHLLNQNGSTLLSPILVVGRATGATYQAMPYVHFGVFDSNNMTNAKQTTLGIRYDNSLYPRMYAGMTTPVSHPDRPNPVTPTSIEYHHTGGIVLAPFDGSLFLFKQLGTGRTRMELDARSINYKGQAGSVFEYDMTYTTGFLATPGDPLSLVPVNPHVQYLEHIVASGPSVVFTDFMDITNSLSSGGQIKLKIGAHSDFELDPTSNTSFISTTGFMVYCGTVNKVGDVGILVN